MLLLGLETDNLGINQTQAVVKLSDVEICAAFGWQVEFIRGKDLQNGFPCWSLLRNRAY